MGLRLGLRSRVGVTLGARLWVGIRVEVTEGVRVGVGVRGWWWSQGLGLKVTVGVRRVHYTFCRVMQVTTTLSIF